MGKFTIDVYICAHFMSTLVLHRYQLNLLLHRGVIFSNKRKKWTFSIFEYKVLLLLTSLNLNEHLHVVCKVMTITQYFMIIYTIFTIQSFTISIFVELMFFLTKNLIFRKSRRPS